MTIAWLLHSLNFKGVSFGVCVCVHVNNPSLTVPHVVSLTVPTITAPVGSNPFEDDEDEEEEEEMAMEQQTTVNHISVNKEEIKMLVNRSKLSANPQPFLSLCFNRSPFSFLFSSITFLPSSL